MRIRSKVHVVGASLVAAAVSSCGGGGNSGNPPPSPPPPTSSIQVNTTAILAEAQKPSETAAPYAVNDAAIVFTDTSETADPVAVGQGN